MNVPFWNQTLKFAPTGKNSFEVLLGSSFSVKLLENMLNVQL